MRIAFDTGGTFTDFALLDDEGGIQIHKVLSTPADPARAVLQGIDDLLERMSYKPRGRGLRVFGATTLITNAVLERKGARIALLVTRGFRDILRIRTEARYDLYNLMITYPEPLAPRELCFGISERISSAGAIVTPLDQNEVLSVVKRLNEERVEAVAVCLLHAYRFPEHERRVGELLSIEGRHLAVSLSSSVAPEIREYERASTTVVNAYTQPLMHRHVALLEKELRTRGLEGQLFFMTSSGGLVSGQTAAAFPVRLIESGPAAGALAAAEYGVMTNERHVLSFDMGGTTAKLCVVRNGQPAFGGDLEVARQERFKPGSGYPLKTRSIQMIEIGAGGGSIARVDQLGLLQVGPSSAGADPGPACYGLGGDEPTVTDADLLLGYVHEDSFLGGEFKLHREAAVVATAGLARKLGVDQDRCSWGIHDLVNEGMARAAAAHAMESGADARAFTLVAFGGAGPVHAYGVAKKLGIRKIICPLSAGVTSAIGLLVAPLAVDLAASLPMRASRWESGAVKELLRDLVVQGHEMMLSAGVSSSHISHSFAVDMRYVGQGHEISVALPDANVAEQQFLDKLLEVFNADYELLYGRRVEGSDVEAITWRVRVVGPKGQLIRRPVGIGSAASSRVGKCSRSVYFEELGGFVQTPVHDHYGLAPGVQIAGPAIVEQRESTAVVGPHAEATVDMHLNLTIRLGSNAR